jgi:hypothetical protein
MSRIYAYTEDGERFLVAIECDQCDVRIKPGPDIADSGWTKGGVHRFGRPNDSITWDHCPEHSQEGV